jgi:hypothetical protein
MGLIISRGREEEKNTPEKMWLLVAAMFVYGLWMPCFWYALEVKSFIL